MTLQAAFKCALKGVLCTVPLLWQMVGCASLPAPIPHEPVHALPSSEAAQTSLGRMANAAAAEPGVSGFKLLISGNEALNTLVALADHAQRTLDLQYYLIHSDDSSRTIMQHVHAAADRGVRVRLLIDDLNTAGQDEGLMRLTRHPNIEVRLYNPLPAGRLYTASRILASLTDLHRINRRMHNKMFVADNALAVTGGRNLGDAYFLRGKDSNFLDIDVLAAGPAVRALSNSFDRFWNDPLAYPVAAIAAKPSGPAAMLTQNATAALAPPAAASTASPASGASAASSGERPNAVSRALDEGRLQLTWVPARVLADKPSKIDAGDSEPAPSEVIVDDIERLLLSARKEAVIISPYFVPGPHGMSIFKQLRSHGVTVRVLTNSLATTDAPAVHIGYAKYREPLLQMGVQLYEMKPDLSMPKRARIGSLGSMGSSRASLHAKVMVIDGETSVVGSMNLDPRSSRLNSEMGVVMRSPSLSRQLETVFNEVTAHCYALSLTSGGKLQWTTQPPDPALAGKYEPGASLWLRAGLKLLGAFAPEEML